MTNNEHRTVSFGKCFATTRSALRQLQVAQLEEHLCVLQLQDVWVVCPVVPNTTTVNYCRNTRMKNVPSQIRREAKGFIFHSAQGHVNSKQSRRTFRS